MFGCFGRFRDCDRFKCGWGGWGGCGGGWGGRWDCDDWGGKWRGKCRGRRGCDWDC